MSEPRYPDGFFARQDEAPDAEFYALPRFVTHIDDATIAALTDVYCELLAPGAELLDLMSSWVSHLPDVSYRRVVGLGLNAEELAGNARLDQWCVHDLNREPELPFADAKRQTVESFERQYLSQALREHEGNVSRTAAAIGMVRQSLQQKIRELGLKVEEFRHRARD